jgi:hypothetical protein
VQTKINKAVKMKMMVDFYQKKSMNEEVLLLSLSMVSSVHNSVFDNNKELLLCNDKMA